MRSTMDSSTLPISLDTCVSWATCVRSLATSDCCCEHATKELGPANAKAGRRGQSHLLLLRMRAAERTRLRLTLPLPLRGLRRRTAGQRVLTGSRHAARVG